MICAICNGEAPLWRNVDGYDYSDCPHCECIAISRDAIDAIDNGTFPQSYSKRYWAKEAEAAKERSWGPALARVSETVFYCRRPIKKFVDIGSGPGFLLDALKAYLPRSKSTFYGVEMFPPRKRNRSRNYIVGHLRDVKHKFDAGVCIEVFEHLTPKMLDELARAMAEKSNPEALYIVNTYLSHGVRTEAPDYIDPLRRGHIISWSLKGIEAIFRPHGFKVIPLRGKSWAFCLEYLSEDDADPETRMWKALPENLRILNDPKMGSAMHVLGLETARAYVQYG